MTQMLDKAIEAMKRLPPEEQDAIAREMLARIEEETEWDTLVATPQSQGWLEQAAKRALAARDRGESEPFDPATKPAR